MLCVGLLIPGCLSTAGNGPPAPKHPEPAEFASTQPTDGSGERGGGQHGFSQAELEIWNDSDFQRRFMRSYIAVTDVEPKVTPEERQKVQAVIDLITGGGEQNGQQQEGATDAEDGKRMREAIAMLEGVRGPEASAVFDYMLGNIYFQRGTLAEARRLYEVAVKKHEKYRRAWSNLAKVYVRQKKFEKARQALQTVVELGGEGGINYGLLGYTYANLGDHVAAESAFRRAVVLDPDRKNWKVGLAQSFFKQQRYAEAASFLNHLIEQDREDPKYWRLQAKAYLGLDQPMTAAQNYEMMSQLGAASFDDLSTLGDIYINEKLYTRGVEAYRRAMQSNAEADPRQIVRAARALAARGAHTATARLLKSIEASYGARLEEQNRKELLKLRARTAVAQGANERQVAVLKQVLRIDPTDGEALMLLGKHYADKWDRQRRAPAATQAATRPTRRSTRPGSTDAGGGAATTPAGHAGGAATQPATRPATRPAGGSGSDAYERAVMYYERAQQLEGQKADAHVRHAQLLVKNQKYGAAVKHLKEAQKIEPRDHVQQYLEQVEQVANN
jgi:tetratricopeptide (TPR) repeat protein